MNNGNNLILYYPQSRTLIHKKELEIISASYLKREITVELIPYKSRPSHRDIEEETKCLNPVLFLAHGNTQPKNILHGPFLNNEDHITTVSYLPLRKKGDVKQFATSVERATTSKRIQAGLTFFAPRNESSKNLYSNIQHTLSNNNIPFSIWSNQNNFQKSVLVEDTKGLGLAMCVGLESLKWLVGKESRHSHLFKRPIGAFLSISCNTLNRYQKQLSVAEKIVLSNYATACLGVVGNIKPCLHDKWVTNISKSLLQGAEHLTELLLQATVNNNLDYGHYRLIGDPLAPVLSTQKSLILAKQNANKLCATSELSN